MISRRRRSRLRPSRRIARPPQLTRQSPQEATAAQVTVEDVSSRSISQVASERTGSRIETRTLALALVVLVLFIGLVARLWILQVVQGASLHELAASTTTRTISVPGPRGQILADDGKTVLAGDVQEDVASITATTNSAGSRVGSPTAEGNLAALVPGLTVAGIKSAIANPSLTPYQPIVVTPGLSASQVTYIEQHPAQFPGVAVTQAWERTYPFSSLAAQTLGYVAAISQSQLAELSKDGYTSSDSVGQFGLEAEYENVLQGKPSTETVTVDPTENVVAESTLVPATPGDNVVLNLNVGLEQKATAALSNELTALHTHGMPAPWGAVTVLGQKGKVLAMVSAPGYNDNWWEPIMTTSHYDELKNAPGDPLLNYAADSEEPPGSTFKLTTATAALNDGLINADTTVDDTGTYTLGTLTLHDSESSGLGVVNVVSALAESSDVFFYTLGDWFDERTKEYGATPIQNVANEYGLGEPSGIDLPANEVATGWVDSLATRQALYRDDPQVYGAPTWYPADNVEMAFGQGQTVTDTLEIANAYATFADGGTRYAPELAAEIESPSGKVVKQIAAKVMGRVSMPASTRSLLSAGFTGAVRSTGGTAAEAFAGFNFTTWSVAGKTGTATTSTNPHVPTTAWFVAYAGPTSDPSKYTVAVEISQAGYGADASAPVVRSILAYLQQHPVG
jgi:penicillin-binding protein 2